MPLNEDRINKNNALPHTGTHTQFAQLIRTDMLFDLRKANICTVHKMNVINLLSIIEHKMSGKMRLVYVSIVLKMNQALVIHSWIVKLAIKFSFFFVWRKYEFFERKSDVEDLAHYLCAARAIMMVMSTCQGYWIWLHTNSSKDCFIYYLLMFAGCYSFWISYVIPKSRFIIAANRINKNIGR